MDLEVIMLRVYARGYIQHVYVEFKKQNQKSNIAKQNQKSNIAKHKQSQRKSS